MIHIIRHHTQQRETMVFIRENREHIDASTRTQNNRLTHKYTQQFAVIAP